MLYHFSVICLVDNFYNMNYYYYYYFTRRKKRIRFQVEHNLTFRIPRLNPGTRIIIEIYKAIKIDHSACKKIGKQNFEGGQVPGFRNISP